MKRILLGILVILTLNNTAFARGPVINGFYIEMPRQKAIDNINKSGLKMDIIPSNDSIKLFDHNKIGLYGFIKFDNDVISIIMFNQKIAFNLQTMDLEKYIYEFCIHYRIPYEKVMKRSDSLYGYINYDEGYSINFNESFTSLSMKQKTSELQFK